MPSWTAPRNRVQFSLPSNRPGGLRVAGEEEDRPERGERDARDEERDPCGVGLEQTGVDHEPDETQRGEREEARQPLERDGGERGLGRADVLRAPLTRSTSPPMVDGSTLPTN